MKILFTLLTVLSAIVGVSGQAALSFHDYSAVTMSGDTISMSQYYGKKVMVVNCASFCSYTPQYTPLEQLYEQYQIPYHFEIIGFPSDDFFQAGTDSDIIHTCQDYGVTFPITEKIHVSAALHGNAVAPVYQWLE